jgi:CheY-like chemotaxis protein
MGTATDIQKSKDNHSASDPSERKVSLLVVEDDENISTAISEYFSRAGYDVKTVEDGLAGVKTALEDPPDAVVLDLMLPKMDGLAVCKELREKANHLPILMLTAKDDIVDKVLGLEMGADDYITKPFSLRELEARIKSVLRRTRTAADPAGAKDESPIVAKSPSVTARWNLRPKSSTSSGCSPRIQDESFLVSTCSKKFGTIRMKAMIAPSILTSIACEPRSKTIPRIPKWFSQFGVLATSSPMNNSLSS